MQSILPTVKLESFEGPFDLLIELARSRQVDLTVISLACLTGEFLRYIEQEQISSETQADFAVIASTLLLLKVHQLLPTPTADKEQEITELTDRLRIYRIYREQALHLRRRWGKQPLLPGPERLVVYRHASFPALTSSELATAMHKVIDLISVVPSPARALRATGRSLQQCMHFFQTRIQALSMLVFQHTIVGYTKHDQATSFLAVLELARRRNVVLEQQHYLGELCIIRYDKL